MRKKFIILLLTAISTLCLAVGLSACGSSSGSSGGLSGGTEQSGSDGGTQQSETGNPGSTGTQESEDQSQSTPGEWDGNEHNLTYVAAVDATCTTDGNIAYWYCADCGTYFSDSAATNEIDAADTVIPATGHTASEAVIEDYVAPTCSAYGSYVEVVRCAECDTVISRETYYIPSTGHSWNDGEITTAPTCTETGVTTYACETCGETKTEAIAATGHTHGEAVIENEIEATCTEDGSYDSVIYCTVCNGEVSRDTIAIPATGHTAGEATTENYVAATCTTASSYDTVVRCSDCGEIISSKTTTIPATGHTAGESATENYIAATCTKDGSYNTVVRCSDCGEILSSETTVIPATGHTASEAVTEKYVAPTCTEDGSYDSVIYCTVCNGEVNRETIVIPATGHTKDEAIIENYVAATCTADGSYDSVIYCSICGEEISRKSIKISATGHIYENGICTSCGFDENASYGLEYTLSSDESYYSVSGLGTCTDTDIVITSTYNSLPVTTIVANAFSEQTQITSIYVPNSVTYIGSAAFGGCSSLTSITLPFVGSSASATKASSSALFGYIFGTNSYTGCTSTTQYYSSSSYAIYYIPSKLTTVTINGNQILYGAFYNCTTLTSVIISDKMETINDYAFSKCTSLTSVYYKGTASQWASISFNGNYFANPVFYAGNLYLNDILATDITLENITTINKYTFAGCTSLTSVIISNSVTSIGNWVFHNCTSLANITIPDSVNSIGGYVFYGCTSLTSITIPNNITSISNSTFYNCSSLTSVTIGYGVETINHYAFYGCTSLTSVYFNGTASQWASISFNDGYANPIYYSNSLYLNEIIATDITLENITSVNAYAFYYCTSLKSVTILNSVTSIGERAFYCCSSLTSIIIPNSITSIDSYVFFYCASLNKVYITDLEAWCNISFTNTYANPMYYADSLYLNNNIITGNIVLSDNVTAIPYGTFKNSKITSISIGNNITSIGSYAFYNCLSLESITIPDSVTSIASYAFANCTELTNISISNVTSIGERAFAYCTSLTSITLPDSVTSIGYAAFSGCSNLVNMSLPFVGSSASATSASSSTLFGYIFGSSDYAGSMYITQQYSSNSYSAFYIPTSLTSVTILGGTIFYGAFINCYSLTSVTIGSEVESIGDYAFHNCYKLVEVYNLSSLTITIGSADNGYVGCYAKNIYTSDGELSCFTTQDGYIFYNDNDTYYLMGYTGRDATLTLPTLMVNGEAVNYSIYQYAFYDNPILISITIPNNVISIGDYAFYKCYKLVEVYNLSSLTITDRSTENGYVGYYAKNVYSTSNGSSNLTTQGDYIFYNYHDTYYLMGYTGSDTALTLPTLTVGSETVSYSIYQDAFSRTNIVSITIHDSITSIGGSAFNRCTSLTSVYYNGTASQWASISFGDATANPLYYADYLYLNGTLATDITIEGINAINAYAFDGYASLESIIIGDDVTTIGNCAFYNCSSLESVTIGNDVTSIGSYAFENCTSLTSIIIPDSVTTISGSAFYNCTSLTSVIV